MGKSRNQGQTLEVWRFWGGWGSCFGVSGIRAACCRTPENAGLVSAGCTWSWGFKA